MLGNGDGNHSGVPGFPSMQKGPATGKTGCGASEPWGLDFRYCNTDLTPTFTTWLVMMGVPPSLLRTYETMRQR